MLAVVLVATLFVGCGSEPLVEEKPPPYQPPAPESTEAEPGDEATPDSEAEEPA